MGSIGLPAAVVEALRAGGQLRYDATAVECGAVTLKAADNLKESVVWVDGEGRDWRDDPHGGEFGYYTIPVVDLLADADEYDHEGILLWIPPLKTFGSWDNDHWDLIVFTGASWDDIVSDPSRF